MGESDKAKKDGDSGKHNDDKSKKPKDKKDDKSLIQVAKSSMLGNVRAQLATEEAEGSSPEDGSKPKPKDDGEPDKAKKDGDSGKHNDDKSKKPKDKKDDKSLIQVAKSSMLGNVRAQL